MTNAEPTRRGIKLPHSEGLARQHSMWCPHHNLRDGVNINHNRSILSALALPPRLVRCPRRRVWRVRIGMRRDTWDRVHDRPAGDDVRKL